MGNILARHFGFNFEELEEKTHDLDLGNKEPINGTERGSTYAFAFSKDKSLFFMKSDAD
jgi:hypothetical protein